MRQKHSTVLLIALGMMAMLALPARAHILTKATANANCQGYALTVNAADLSVGTTYTIDYSFTVTCGGGSPVTIPGSVTFIATASTEAVTASGAFGGTANTCIVTGSATLTSSGSTVTINIDGQGMSPAKLTCPPTACVIPPSGTEIGGSPVSWNGFTAPAGSVVWINAHLDAKKVPTDTITTVDFTGVTLVVNTTTYVLPMDRSCSIRRPRYRPRLSMPAAVGRRQ